MAGTKFRGEFEERMQQLLDGLRRAQDTIVFIDEIHTIVGAGSTQGASTRPTSSKPALARGELQTIGATTLDEYRENIETDAALERRFQKVLVEPTTPEVTLQILRNIAPGYERHHKVRYSDEALRACVTLTPRRGRRRAPGGGGRGPPRATQAWWASRRPWRRSHARSAARAPGSRTRTARSASSSSSARRAWSKRCWPKGVSRSGSSTSSAA